jgi:hypothetical protein
MMKFPYGKIKNAPNYQPDCMCMANVNPTVGSMAAIMRCSSATMNNNSAPVLFRIYLQEGCCCHTVSKCPFSPKSSNIAGFSGDYFQAKNMI